MTEPTQEQVQREMSVAGPLVRQWHESMAAFFGDGNGDALTDIVATALARVRIEARGEALGEAEGKVIATHIPSSVASGFREFANVSAWLANIGLAIRALRSGTR